MHDFAYHRPNALPEAVALLTADEEARPLAGGQSLIPILKQRLARPSALVDLAGIPGLAGITPQKGRFWIGAMTRQADLAADGRLRRHLPALCALALQVGDPQVRNQGTLGGSVANNDPAADSPAAILGLGAEILTDRRRLTADDFFVGLFETALQPGEIVTGFDVPLPDAAGYARIAQPASRHPLAGVFVARFGRTVRLAVTGAGQDGVFRPADFEAALSDRFVPEAVEGLFLEESNMNADLHATPAYRAQLVRVLAARAVRAALEGTGTG